MTCCNERRLNAEQCDSLLLYCAQHRLACIQLTHMLLCCPFLKSTHGNVKAADIPCLVAQLHLKDIHDVGLKSPTDAADFFRRAGFDADREGSVPMTLSVDRFFLRPLTQDWAGVKQRLRRQHLVS